MTRVDNNRAYFNDQVIGTLAKFWTKHEAVHIAKTLIWNKVFAGEVTAKWGNVLELKRKSETISTRKLEKLLMKALNYKYLLGFVPIKKIKKGGLKKMFIPEIETLKFYTEIDPVTGKKKVGFEDCELSQARGKGKSKEKNYKVYVWDDSVPLHHTGELNSAVFKMLQRHILWSEFLNNKRHADYESAHPPIILGQEVPKTKVDTIDETNMAEEYDLPYYKNGEMNKIRDAEFRFRSIDNFSDRVDESGVGKSSVDMYVQYTNASQQSVYTQRKRNWANNFIALPIGEDIKKQVNPETSVDLLQWQESDNKIIFSLMGLSAHYAIGTKTPYERVDKRSDKDALLEETVKSLRIALSRFFQSSYHWCFGKRDEKLLQKERATAKLDKIEDDEYYYLELIEKGKDRINVVFKDPPFIDENTSIQDIQAALELGDRLGAFTHKEMILTVRNFLKMKPDEDEKKFIRTKRKLLLLEEPETQNEEKKKASSKKETQQGSD
jgi:hypothetical protein